MLTYQPDDARASVQTIALITGNLRKSIEKHAYAARSEQGFDALIEAAVVIALGDVQDALADAAKQIHDQFQRNKEAKND